MLDIGQQRGAVTPVNQCQALVRGIIRACAIRSYYCAGRQHVRLHGTAATMTRRGVFFTLALLSGLVAAFAFLGYVMAGSFSVAAADGAGHRRAAVVWGLITLASLAASVTCVLGAWRAHSKRRDIP